MTLWQDLLRQANELKERTRVRNLAGGWEERLDLWHELTNLVARHASKSQVTCDRTADRPDRAGRPITIFTKDESAHSGGVDLRQLNRSSAELLDQKSSHNMATLSPCV